MVQEVKFWGFLLHFSRWRGLRTRCIWLNENRFIPLERDVIRWDGCVVFSRPPSPPTEPSRTRQRCGRVNAPTDAVASRLTQ